jgi:formate hydrogenlyase transcriptional activator
LIRHQSELARFSDFAVRQAEQNGVHSGCAVPLIVQGRPLGALSVVSFHEEAFSQQDARLLEQCSTQIAIAVQNALNFECARKAEREVGEERDRSKLLLEINNALVSHLDLKQLVIAISSSLRQVMHQDFVGLATYDRESGKMFAHAMDSASGTAFDVIQFDPQGSVTGLCFDLGHPVYLPHFRPEEFPSPATKRFLARGLETIYAVPLTVHKRKLGAVAFASSKEDAWNQNQQDLLQEVAKQVGIAAANALAMRDVEALKDKLAQEKLYLEDEIRGELNFDEIIGQSPALREVLRLVETVAPSDSTVLLLGETGTGKELIARAVHDHSRRKSRTFVKLNCAAIPTGLLESELFGHEKGAFTGAIAQKIGRLELADQGTLFLDEVGDIPPEIQPKLLRALQEREFERLGSTYTKKVNVRLVAATNRDLEKMTETREFRSDLYYRLNVFPIRVPPLRERHEDIPVLVRYFAEKFSRQMQKPLESIPADTMSRLQRWHWPGNVRELENLIERAVILSTGTALQVPLPDLKLSSVNSAVQRSPAADGTDRDRIIKILRETRGVLAGPNGAASRLGLKRTTLQYKMKKLGITRDHWWPNAS